MVCTNQPVSIPIRFLTSAAAWRHLLPSRFAPFVRGCVSPSPYPTDGRLGTGILLSVHHQTLPRDNFVCFERQPIGANLLFLYRNFD
ncbi:hypothetical protein OPV22_028140 [Ensete ventricosum]|uniref:Uncharacterized protein n=1 Tax=Ensete ventricosum TaxID=4639 RepID=A0AAV8Q7G3_ENSVE|nr:hypothetical protein OPV22_028140 [Ensete ventricosum]